MKAQKQGNEQDQWQDQEEQQDDVEDEEEQQQKIQQEMQQEMQSRSRSRSRRSRTRTVSLRVGPLRRVEIRVGLRRRVRVPRRCMPCRLKRRVHACDGRAGASGQSSETVVPVEVSSARHRDGYVGIRGLPVPGTRPSGG